MIVHARWLTARGTRWLLLAALASGGCEDPGPCGPDGVDCARPVLTTAIVSDAPGAVGGVAYVSLPPGTFPDAEDVAIRNPRTGRTRTVPVQDGGFDPVPVEAKPDDTLELDIRVAGGDVLGFMVTVPPSRRPVVVRTDPPPRKRDVPLNAVMLVVFSEPIDAATVTASSVVLSLGGVPVAGTLAFGDAAHLTVTFTPADSLAAGAEYVLRVTQAIADLDGDALEAPLAVEFGSEPPWALIVSDPAGTSVYASLPPWNSYGERVAIRNRRTGAQVAGEMADGGFDPIPIPADVGDTLEFRMDLTVSTVPAEFLAVVPSRRPPVVVRADPAPGRRDVSPDAVPMFVFSEPVDPATLSNDPVQLLIDGLPVAGTLAFGDAAQLTVSFTPTDPLAVGAEYELLVTQAIGDLDGDTLETSVTVGFATNGDAAGLRARWADPPGELGRHRRGPAVRRSR
jgi:hypothetical protein